tara:strand:- start:3052 stop:5331 length:2280 start_codon:yes stop_codon:yes gene_type:complete
MVDERNLTAAEEELKILERRIELERDLLDLTDENDKKKAKILTSQREIAKLEQEIGTATGQNKQLLEEQKQALEGNVAALNEEVGLSQQQLDITQERYRVQLDLREQIAEEAELRGTIRDISSELLGIQLDQLATAKGLTIELIKMAHQLDAANVALAKSTGYTQAFAADIIDVTAANNTLGLTLAEGSEIIGGLTTNMTLFATVSDNTRKSLRDTAASLSKMGVSAEETGVLFDGLTRGMNMTVTAAERVAIDFDQLGQQIGLPTSQMVKDFSTLQPQLARYGAEGVKVFKELSKEARALGMDLQEAFNIAEAFDTFQGAADLAGKLNAQIGLQLNSVELMTASHEDRIKILRQEFDLRGKNFKDMDRRQKQAIAEVLGVDVDLASRLFGDPVELRKYNKEQKELKERAEAMTTAMDKFKVAMQDLFLKIAPVVEIIMGFVQFLADSGIAQVLLFVAAMKGILTIVATLATTLPIVGPMLGSLFTMLGFVAPTMPAFLTNLGAALQRFFAFMTTISPAQIAKGALALVGLAASLGLLGLSLRAFTDVGLDELATAAGAIGILSLAILALGAVMYTGIGAIVFAAGIVALLSLSAALVALGGALHVISSALGNRGSGIAGSLDIIANAMARLGSSEVINGLRSFVVELGSLAEAFGKFDADTGSMASLERIVSVSTTVSTGDLENMKAVMGQVQATFNASQAADSLAMREAANATASAGQSRSSAQTRRQPIQLIVNDRVFGEAVMDVYEEYTNPLNIT